MKLSIFLINCVLSMPRCDCKCEKESPSNFSPNDFACVDDTNFKHFITSTEFVVKSCAVPGSCFTRVPPNKNPCIGKELAQQIDGQ